MPYCIAVCSSHFRLAIIDTYCAAHCRGMHICRVYQNGIARLRSVMCVQAQHALIAAPWHLPVQLKVQSELTPKICTLSHLYKGRRAIKNCCSVSRSDSRESGGCRLADVIADCAGSVRENIQLRRAHRCLACSTFICAESE